MNMRPTDAIEQYWRAWNQHDLDALIELVDEDIVFQFPTDPRPVRGKDNLQQVWSTLFASLVPDITDEVLTTVIKGDTVACEYVERGTFGDRPYVMPIAGFFCFNASGLMNRMRVYWDTASLSHQTGVDINAIGSMDSHSVAAMSAAQRTPSPP
jgi:ketosteroid isomerase-like protein